MSELYPCALSRADITFESGAPIWFRAMPAESGGVDDEVAPAGSEPRGKLGLQRVLGVEGTGTHGRERRLVRGEQEKVDHYESHDRRGQAPARPGGAEDHDGTCRQRDGGGDDQVRGDGPNDQPEPARAWRSPP